MSIGVVAMFTNILLEFALKPKEIKSNFKNYFQDKKLFSLGLIFWVSLLALSYSAEKTIGLNFVINKLPLFVIPFAFSLVKDFPKKTYVFLLQYFVLAIFISSFFVLVSYFSDYKNAAESLSKGKAIWVPFNHIRYSVMTVFAFITSLYLYLNSSKTEHSFLKTAFTFWNLFLAIYLFLFIHFLAVRSGWLVLYLSLLVWFVSYVFTSKKYKYLIFGFLLAIAIPYIAYQNVANIKNKVNYMKYDWEQFQQNKIGSNSDSRRMVSYDIGLELAKKYFPLGLGTGSIQSKMNEIYEVKYPEIIPEDRIAPHNQFLFTLIDLGLVGLFALIIALFYPIVSLKNKRKNIFYILFWLIATTPLLFDISLEMQLGITFFALFSSLILKRISLSENNV